MVPFQRSRRHQPAETAIFETLGNLGDFVGGVAVVVTLVYVASQIRQNTQATRAATFLGLTNAWQDYLLSSASAELSDLRSRVDADPGSVSESDYLRLFYLARVLFRRYENDFFQYRSGTFDAGAWEGYRHSLVIDILATATMRAFWAQQRAAFPPEFIAFVDEQIVFARRVEQVDLATGAREWKELVKRESAAK